MSAQNPSGRWTSKPQVRVGVLGAPGSFSEGAANAYAQREGFVCRIHNQRTFEEVLVGLGEGRLDLGVLPVVNTVGGLVRGAFEALGRYPFRPVGQIGLRVRHALIVRSPEVQARDVQRVVSQPQALAQCARFLAREFPGREWLEWGDTASAARDLARGELDRGVAVLASVRAAHLHGLHVLREDVQDDPRNETRFVVVKRRLP